MLITLKESEIAVAVKRYLTQQGINLSGKAVGIEFTATRSNGGGIRADVSIDEIDSDIPGFTDAASEEEDTKDAGKPALAVVTGAAATETAAAVTDTKAAAKSVKEIAAAAAAATLEEDGAAAAPAAAETSTGKPTSSLFG